MNFNLRPSAEEIALLYDELNRQRTGKTWETHDLIHGLAGDAADLGSYYLAKVGLTVDDNLDLRVSESNADKLLRHELADILWSVCTISQKLGINIGKVFNELSLEYRHRLDAWETYSTIIYLQRSAGYLIARDQVRRGVRLGEYSIGLMEHMLCEILVADCAIAEKLEIDLNLAYTETMNDLKIKISVKLRSTLPH